MSPLDLYIQTDAPCLALASLSWFLSPLSACICCSALSAGACYRPRPDRVHPPTRGQREVLWGRCGRPQSPVFRRDAAVGVDG